jgi:hypothetical protein
MENEVFLINVNIGGTVLPLRIPRGEEEVYRRAEKLVVKYLDHFLLNYRNKSREEVLVFLAYHFAVMLNKQELSEDIEPLAKKIQDLDNELKILLQEE